MQKKRRVFMPLRYFILTLFMTLAGVGSAGAAGDMYRETFDSRQDGASINGIDSWSVNAGSSGNAVTKAGTTVSGMGLSLDLRGSPTPVQVTRSASYGNLSPAWVEFVIKPGLGKQSPAAPSTGIAAVCFNNDGQIMASDGSSWVSTGQTFDSSTWYKILLELDFTKHLYSIYISPATMPKLPFVADKEKLHFIDPTINSISALGFNGAYNLNQASDTLVDEIMVNFIDRLQITTPTQTVLKGSASGPFIVQLQNANSEPQAAWQDTVLELRSTAGTGQFSANKDPWFPITQVIVPQSAQQAVFYYKDTAEGRPVISAKESPNNGWQEATQQVNVVAEINAFDVSVSSPQIAGQAFTAEIAAKTPDGNADTLYNGTLSIQTKYLSPASGTKLVAPASVSGFVNGVLKVPLTYADCGTIQIGVHDENNPDKTGVSGQIQFFPAKFEVAPDGTQQVVSRPFNVTVSALNASGDGTPNYNGTVTLQAAAVSPADTSGGSFSPAQITAEQFTRGAAQLPVFYDRWGTVDLVAADSGMPSQKGTSKDLTFAPAALQLKIPSPSGGRDFFYTGETIDATLSVLDAQNLPISNFQGTVSVSSSPDAEQFRTSIVFTGQNGGRRSLSFLPKTSGSYVVQAELPDYHLTVQSQTVQVKQASIEVLSTVAPVGTTEVQIQLIDENGKRITSGGNVSIRLIIREDDPNNSVFLTSPGKPILFQNGLAKIGIGDTEAETVTITPETDAGFKIQSGTVTFGRIGKGGVGTLMLWEPKDEDKDK